MEDKTMAAEGHAKERQSRERQSKEKQTKENLLSEAKKEFLEKGYSKASLRSICRNAGVTTGALYFFFEGKEDLFSSIVKGPLDNLHVFIQSHFNQETERLATMDIDISDDIQISYKILDYLYTYQEEFYLLLMRSQGSGYENCLDDLIAISQKHYRILADRMAEYMQSEVPGDYTIHWVAHLQADIFVQFLKHGLTKEEAQKELKTLIMFLMHGWFGMFENME